MKHHLILQKLTLASMMMAIGVLLLSPAFAFPVILFGIPAVRIDLVAIPIIIAGILLGPGFGLGIGILTDILGYLLFTHVFGPYHIGFTINLALTGMFAGLIHFLFQQKSGKIPLYLINLVTLSIMSIIGIVFVGITDTIRVGSSDVVLTTLFKVIFIVGIVIFYALIVIMQHLGKKKLKRFQQMDVVIFMVVMIEIFVSILLTPIWVEDLYGAPPYMLGVFLRVMRAMWLIPVKVYFVLYVTEVAKVIFGENVKSVKTGA